jgi:hypothetical protein
MRGRKWWLETKLKLGHKDFSPLLALRLSQPFRSEAAVKGSVLTAVLRLTRSSESPPAEEQGRRSKQPQSEGGRLRDAGVHTDWG